MPSYNRVVLIGNLTRDVELRYTSNQTAVTELGLAVKDRVKRGDEWVDEPVFLDVTVWGRTAEIASEFLSKGSPVFIEGRLRLDTWETDGQKRSKLKVVCERMQLIGGRSRGSSPQKGEKEPAPRSAAEPAYGGEPAGVSQGGPANQGPPEDEIPF